MTKELDDYQIQARAQFDLQVKQLEYVARMQAEYGKWIVVTLLFLHTSAIAGLLYKSQVLENRIPIACFALGSVFAVLTGGSAWVNFSASMRIYINFCDVRMLVNRKYWPSGETVKSQQFWLRFTMLAALASALVSLLLWLTGAFLLVFRFPQVETLQLPLVKIISVGGILLELAGFIILALELLRTNRDILAYTNATAGEITTANTMVVSDDSAENSIKLTGGSLGTLSPSAKLLRDRISAGKKCTLLGIGITIAGVVVQLVAILLA